MNILYHEIAQLSRNLSRRLSIWYKLYSMQGKIKNKQVVAQGTLEVTFDLLNQEIAFIAGQYIFVTLINPPYPDEKSNRRHFSIVNSPNQKNIMTITTRLRDSGFKKSLKELPIGTEVELGPIGGNFTLPENPSKPLVFTSEGRKICFIAGGIGITPYMSMIRYVKENKLNYKITLLYSNRDQSSTAYLEELHSLANSLPNFNLILTMTEDNSWTGENRKIDAGFIKDYFPSVNENFYMVAGPPAMVEAVEQALKGAGVNEENIKAENFSGY